jgi:ABC-type transport system involved in cytochrome bd biosynthesis fused ATPase/permease subunit
VRSQNALPPHTGTIKYSFRGLSLHDPQRIFATKELRDKTNDKCIYYYSQSRIEKLVGLIITLIIFILLVLPVVAMYRLTSIGDRNSTFDAVGILVVFTLLFSAAMSLLTKAKRHELFAASAAYCAVLVVFISNLSNK